MTRKNADCHADVSWLERRLDLFRSFFAPSVGRLNVPAVLLCSNRSADMVSQRSRGSRLGHGRRPGRLVRRLGGGAPSDSDQDGLRRCRSRRLVRSGGCGRPATSKSAPRGSFSATTFPTGSSQPISATCRRRWRPSRAAATPTPAITQSSSSTFRARHIEGAFLLQVFHGGNVSTRQALVVPPPSPARPARSVRIGESLTRLNGERGPGAGTPPSRSRRRSFGSAVINPP